jgi:DNA-directed RNA polymerase subunit RPC12/RpoP
MGILGEIFKSVLNGEGKTPPQSRPPQAGGVSFPQRQVYACKYCGTEYPSVQALTVNWCPNHPAGKNKFHHELYEGGVKQQYTCKYCGMSCRTLRDLTWNFCQRNPSGKCHEPAL